MIPFVHFRKKRYIGFDLGARGVRAVEVQGRAGSWQVSSAVVHPLPPGAVRDGMVLVPDKVVAALDKLAAEQGWKGRRVFASVGGSRLITRHLRLPLMPREELDKAVRYEAEQYLPVGTAELSTDFAVLGKEQDGEGEKLEVLLAAVPLDTARTYAELFEAAGLSLMALDIVPLAWQRVLVAALGDSLADQAVGVLDLGYSCTHIVILYGSRVELCRSLPQGWGVAEASSAAYEAAAAMAPPVPPAPSAGTALEEVLGSILNEMRRSVDFFRVQRRSAVWGSLYLGGALGGSSEVCALLEAEIGVPVKPFWPLAEGLVADPELVVALGTALRQVIP
ncbi:MAG: type IV pilus assembly protein PilM [Moorellales bacterium]